MQLLLLAKADPDIEGPDVQTPLFDAALGGSAWMCRGQMVFCGLWIIDINFLDAKMEMHFQIYMVSINSWNLFIACSFFFVMSQD